MCHVVSCVKHVPCIPHVRNTATPQGDPMVIISQDKEAEMKTSHVMICQRLCRELGAGLLFEPRSLI